LQPHIGKQMRFKKYENINGNAENGDGPIPDIVFGCKVHANKPVITPVISSQV
jgi:hypothetical protein